MVTTYTANPSGVLPGQVVGNPITHLPWVFCCRSGEGKHCGWARAANDHRQVVEIMAAKRKHEGNCAGGLIVTGAP